MALHVLKVHILIYFHVFVLETICNAKTFYLLIKKDLFMIQMYDFFKSLARNSMLFWFEKNYDVNITLSN